MDGVVVVTGQDLAIGTERHATEHHVTEPAVDPVRMAHQGVPEAARGHIPQLDGTVTGAGQGLASGTERHTVDPGPMSQGVLEGARNCIPQANEVAVDTGQGLAMGTERQAADPILVVLQGVSKSARGRIPQPDGAVPTATGTGQRLPVRTEHHTVNPGLRFQGVPKDACGRIPQRTVPLPSELAKVCPSELNTTL